MRRIVITLEVEDGVLWGDVADTISRNTPGDSVQVGALSGPIDRPALGGRIAVAVSDSAPTIGTRYYVASHDDKHIGEFVTAGFLTSHAAHHALRGFPEEVREARRLVVISHTRTAP